MALYLGELPRPGEVDFEKYQEEDPIYKGLKERLTDSLEDFFREDKGRSPEVA